MFLPSDNIAHAQYLFWCGKCMVNTTLIPPLNSSNSGNLFDWLSLPVSSVNSILFLVEPKQTG